MSEHASVMSPLEQGIREVYGLCGWNTSPGEPVHEWRYLNVRRESETQYSFVDNGRVMLRTFDSQDGSYADQDRGQAPPDRRVIVPLARRRLHAYVPRWNMPDHPSEPVLTTFYEGLRIRFAKLDRRRLKKFCLALRDRR